MLGAQSANEVLIALKAKLKCERDKHFHEVREASTKAAECVFWLEELDRLTRQQERFQPAKVAEQGAEPTKEEKQDAS